MLAVAQYPRGGGGEPGQGGDGAFRPDLLDHAHGRVDHDHQCDDHRVRVVADGQRQGDG
ncbi:hypothetical protein KAURM247S_00840 [Kitasatospora aureofaciens]